MRIMRLATPGAWLIAAALLAMNHVAHRLDAVFLPLLALGVLILAGFGPAAVTYLAECSESFVADRAALMAFYTVALAGGGALGRSSAASRCGPATWTGWCCSGSRSRSSRTSR